MWFQPILLNSFKNYRKSIAIIFNSVKANQPEHRWFLLCIEDNKNAILGIFWLWHAD